MLWALLIVLCAAIILKKVWNRLETLEGFADGVERSDKQNVEEGASSLFNWGLPKTSEDDKKSDGGGGKVPEWNRWTPGVPARRHGGERKKEKECQDVTDMDCRKIGKCPITLHPDITKYVLKSSVPPCPDMNDYVLKSEMPPNVDLDKYILKSEIPHCPRCPDMKDYIEKSEIPACPPRVKCPVCPICPRCNGGGGGNGDDINMNKYMLKSECRRLLREQERGNRRERRINRRENRREIRNAENNYEGGGDGGVGGVNGGGFFNIMMDDIKNIFGNGGTISSSGSYGADGSYDGLTTQGLAVGDVYKKA